MVRLKATAGRGSAASDGSIQSVRPVVSQDRAPRPVVAGEMTVFQETGGMEDDGDIAVGVGVRHPGLDRVGALFREARTGADDTDLEAAHFIALWGHVRLLRRFCDPLLADRPDPLF